MRLLLAEDEELLSKALVVILRHNGYDVEAAYDGEEALEALQTGMYDGAVLDIMMPKLDGITVLKRIRERGNTIPILLLTAKSETDDKVQGLDNGANDYMTKPFVAKELLARIRAMVRNQEVLSDSVLHFGNTRLDRSTNELSSPTGSFGLGSREFQVMEVLMSSPGHLIAASRFIEKVCSAREEVDERALWIYICYLRKKLKALQADIVIRGTQNREYSLEALNDKKTQS